MSKKYSTGNKKHEPDSETPVGTSNPKQRSNMNLRVHAAQKKMSLIPIKYLEFTLKNKYDHYNAL